MRNPGAANNCGQESPGKCTSYLKDSVYFYLVFVFPQLNASVISGCLAVLAEYARRHVVEVATAPMYIIYANLQGSVVAE